MSSFLVFSIQFGRILDTVFIPRVGKRAISSVVPKTDLEIQDFKVVNELILG